MNEEFLFLREIDAVDGRIEISRTGGASYTRISFGCFSLDIDDVDELAFTALMTRVLAQPDVIYPAIELCTTQDLHIGTVREHREIELSTCEYRVWISSDMCHAVMSLDTLRALTEALTTVRMLHRQHLLQHGEAGRC